MPQAYQRSILGLLFRLAFFTTSADMLVAARPLRLPWACCGPPWTKPTVGR